MSTEYKFEDDISKIEVPPGVTLDKDTLAALQEHMKEISGCLSLGPLKLCWNIQLPSVTVTVSVFGITLGTIHLDPSKPCQRLSINLHLVSGYVELCIKDSCLVLNGQVCKFGSCTNWNNKTIFCWG
jgi:hypothetical protein